MTVCAIKLCRNYKGRLKSTKHATYHRIPSNPVIRGRWIDVIRKSRGEATWKPTKTTVVCSDHFHSKDILNTVNKNGRRRLKKEAVPSKALFLSSLKSSESEDDDDDIDMLEKSNFNEAGCSGTCREVRLSSDAIDILLPDEAISGKSANATNKTETEVDESFSDLDSIYDSPKKAKLRQDFRRSKMLEKKHRLKIQSLRRKILRLKKKVASFKQIITVLKKELKKKAISNIKEKIRAPQISQITEHLL